MKLFFQLLLGAALAVVFILFARTRGPRREMFVYSIGLVVAALVYFFFSIAGAITHRLIIEVIGVAVFTLIAVLGLRVSAWFLVFGWTAHVLWDVLLHIVGRQAFVPGWYPVLCISFDLIVAAAIAVRHRKGRHGSVAEP